MDGLKEPKYLKGLKTTTTKFDFKVTDDGQYKVDYSNGRNASTAVIDKLKTLVNDLNTTSEDVKKMLSAYVLDDSIDINQFVNAVNGGMNSMASQMSTTIQEILTEALGRMDSAEKLDQQLIQNQTDTTNQYGAGGDGTPGGTTPATPATPETPTDQPTTPTVQPSAGDEATAAALGITLEQLDIVKATIRHEAGNNPEEIANVASCVRNRMLAGNWGGTDPYSVITAKGQFSSYLGGYYKQYTGGNYYQGDAATAAQVDDILNNILTGATPPTHNYQSFRSAGSPNGVQLTPGGNKYR